MEGLVEQKASRRKVVDSFFGSLKAAAGSRSSESEGDLLLSEVTRRKIRYPLANTRRHRRKEEQ